MVSAARPFEETLTAREDAGRRPVFCDPARNSRNVATCRAHGLANFCEGIGHSGTPPTKRTACLRFDGHAASPRNLIAAVSTGSPRSSGAAGMGSATAATWRSHSGEKPAGVDGLQAPRRDWPDLPPDRQDLAARVAHNRASTPAGGILALQPAVGVQ
jgi:hypothetical protein